MIATFLILIVTIILFVSNRVRPDLVALLSSISLFFAGLIDSRQVFAGFSDPTVMMITGLLVVSLALTQTGVTAWLSAHLLSFAGQSERRVLLVLMLGTALCSGFLSNTGIVAMLLPATIFIARRLELSPSRFLLPLAFAANTGGLLTMIGTPPNIVVTGALTENELAPFQFFEFTLLGLPLLLILVVYILLFGRSLFGKEEDGVDQRNFTAKELSESYGLERLLFKVEVSEGSASGKTLSELALGANCGMQVLYIERMEDSKLRKIHLPGPNECINVSDSMIVKRIDDAFDLLPDELGFTISPLTDHLSLSKRLLSVNISVIEIMIPPRSSLVGKTIRTLRKQSQEIEQAIAIKRGDQTISDVVDCTLQSGDVLLIRANSQNLKSVSSKPTDYLILSHFKGTETESLTTKGYVALAILALMVLSMSFQILPASVASMSGAIAMVVLGCLNLNDAYQQLNWQSVVLIAAMIPMSIALNETGGALFVAQSLVSILGGYDPIWLLLGVFILTSGMSQIMSNTATTILIAPIVLVTASQLSLSPYPFMMAVAVAASTAFLTPIGTATNVMVMSPGRYSFKDYLKAGTPLVCFYLLVSLLLIPIIWPFKEMGP